MDDTKLEIGDSVSIMDCPEKGARGWIREIRGGRAVVVLFGTGGSVWTTNVCNLKKGD